MDEEAARKEEAERKEEARKEEAAKKEQKRLEKEKQIIQMKRDSLIREEAIDKLNLDKIKEKWYSTLIDTKVPEMQDNLKYILHYMERLVEADTYRKLLFEEERLEYEESGILQAQSHTSALERLYEIYLQRIKDLEEVFNNNLEIRQEQAHLDFEKLESRESLVQENLTAMLFLMKENRDSREYAMNCDIFLKIDDEKSKNSEKTENLKSRLENKMEQRWNDILTIISDYTTNTEPTRKEYHKLKIKDDADSKIIHQQMKKTQKLFEQLEVLKNCLDDCYAPTETIQVINDLRDERTKFFDTFKKLKLLLDDEIKKDDNKLKALTVVSNQTIAALKAVCKKGEYILTLYRICNKLETECEKVLPVGSSLYMPKIPEHLDRKSSRHYKAKTVDFEMLNKFWRKVGNIHLSILALKKSIADMEKENENLKGNVFAFLKKFAKKN